MPFTAEGGGGASELSPFVEPPSGEDDDAVPIEVDSPDEPSLLFDCTAATDEPAPDAELASNEEPASNEELASSEESGSDEEPIPDERPTLEQEPVLIQRPALGIFVSAP